MGDGEVESRAETAAAAAQATQGENLVLLQRAIESTSDGINLADMDGRSLYQNEAFVRTYGFHADELNSRGGPISLFDRPEIAEEVFSRIRTGSPWSGEVELRCRSGEVLPTLLRASSVTDEAGKRVGIVMVCTDVSERRRLDKEVREHQVELAHVLRISTLGETVTGLAHELNQPLSGIVSYAKGCAHRLKAGTLEGQAVVDILERIATEALRAGEITRRLRTLVRREKPVRDEVDLNRVVREVARLVTAEARQRHVRVHLRMGTPLPPVRIDRLQIEQVLLSLVQNAFDAMADVPPDARLLSISTSATEDGFVEVAVRDSGRGLGAGTAEKVFEAFFTTKERSLGMGLAISRTIVEAHDGRFTVQSGPDGATFRFTLPVANRGNSHV